MMASNLTSGTVETGQAEIIAFLCRPETHGGHDAVQRMDTHISTIILVGARAYKLKRAVRFDYLDYSTLELRHRYCDAEVAINRRTAPGIYDGVVAVTREADGSLALEGEGQPVEYLVAMKRFDQEDLLDRVVARGALDETLTRRLADRIAAFHDKAETGTATDGAASFARMVAENANQVMLRSEDVFDSGDAQRFSELLSARAGRAAPLLDVRARAGRVRRCHGDLHLRNICLFEGEPTLFDAIDFDDRLNMIDVFYDLAFLLMDLEFRSRRDLANSLLNRYLDRNGDYDGLGALQLFMACRAGIRAHTSASAADAHISASAADTNLPASSDAAAGLYDDARNYLKLGLEFLRPVPARLVAVGGLSGVGKSVLAHGLSPKIGAAPGAVHLRSDVLRKRLHDQAPETPLTPEAFPNAYGEDISQMVHGEMRHHAAAALDAGYSVICDATYMTGEQRRGMELVGEAAGVPFTGLWLDAAVDKMTARIRGRRNDASDADETVLRRQLEADLGRIDWHIIPAGGNAIETLRAAQRALDYSDAHC